MPPPRCRNPCIHRLSSLGCAGYSTETRRPVAGRLDGWPPGTPLGTGNDDVAHNCFHGFLLVAGGVLTVADRRARHRSILNRSGHTVPVLTAGYTILAVLCSSAMFLAGFQSFMFFGNLGSSTLIVGGLAFLSVGGVILAATTATERSPPIIFLEPILPPEEL